MQDYGWKTKKGKENLKSKMGKICTYEMIYRKRQSLKIK